MYRFKLQFGSHVESKPNGEQRIYQQGDIVESELELDKLHPPVRNPGMTEEQARLVSKFVRIDPSLQKSEGTPSQAIAKKVEATPKEEARRENQADINPTRIIRLKGS